MKVVKVAEIILKDVKLLQTLKGRHRLLEYTSVEAFELSKPWKLKQPAGDKMTEGDALLGGFI